MKKQRMAENLLRMSMDGSLGKEAMRLLESVSDAKFDEILEQESVWILAASVVGTAPNGLNQSVLLSVLVTAFYLGTQQGADVPPEFKEG